MKRAAFATVLCGFFALAASAGDDMFDKDSPGFVSIDQFPGLLEAMRKRRAATPEPLKPVDPQIVADLRDLGLLAPGEASPEVHWKAVDAFARSVGARRGDMEGPLRPMLQARASDARRGHSAEAMCNRAAGPATPEAEGFCRMRAGARVIPEGLDAHTHSLTGLCRADRRTYQFALLRALAKNAPDAAARRAVQVMRSALPRSYGMVMMYRICAAQAYDDGLMPEAVAMDMALLAVGELSAAERIGHHYAVGLGLPHDPVAARDWIAMGRRALGGADVDGAEVAWGQGEAARQGRPVAVGSDPVTAAGEGAE